MQQDNKLYEAILMAFAAGFLFACVIFGILIGAALA